MADRKKTAATTSSGRPQTNASSSKSVPVEALVARRLGDMCNYLGIGEDENHLFWIAEMALVAKLPPYWKEYKDKEGHVSSFPVHSGVDFRPPVGRCGEGGDGGGTGLAAFLDAMRDTRSSIALAAYICACADPAGWWLAGILPQPCKRSDELESP